MVFRSRRRPRRRKRPENHKFVGVQDYNRDPSPEQIRERCLQIQESWDEETRWDRRVTKCGEYDPQVHKMHFPDRKLP